ncbi:MAG TPA: type II toxin-antitoxin system VapC family toxin [Thermomicrobiales bacterium]|nr:type II toxin-antitoxin system VapC family toxin [Thermomicrobiales bacterium]
MTGARPRRDYVVDASVAIKLFVPEPLAEQAEAVFATLTARPASRLHVPDLFFSECANILWKYVWRSGYPAEDARQDIVDLLTLAVRSVSTATLVAEALEIALTQRVTVYDACSVALAAQLQAPLLTADEALLRKLRPTSYWVEWLGNFPVTPHPPAT